MTSPVQNAPSRRLTCARCATVFACNPSGPCWCAEETFRLPVSADGGDCLCPDCLRKLAQQAPRAAAP